MTSLLQPSMTGGELSPSLYARVDLARYLTSLKTCRNFIVQQYGGAINRPGTSFVGEVSDSAYFHRLIPFEFSTVQTYVLEFGHLTMRVIKDGGYVESSPGVIYELVTPYSSNALRSLSDLELINWTQSADVLTVVHEDYYPRQFSRTDHAAWSVAAFANAYGPFQPINVATGLTVYVSAATGSVTVTASSALFDAGMIGTQFYIEQKDYGVPWEPGKAVLIGDIRRSDGKYYESLTAATTGSLRPTHDADDWSDGAVTWRFLHPGFGYGTITAVASATVCTMTVVSRIPDAAVGVGGATYKWAKAAWGGDQGYPCAVAYFQNRQIFGGTSAEPQRNWMSKTGNYVDFGTSQPLVADDSINFPIPGRQVNAVRHYVELDKLAILTSGSEWVVNGGQEGIIAPDTISVRPQGRRGSARIPPVVIGNTAIFIQDKGKTIRELGFDFASDSYTGRDLTQMASHLFSDYTIVDWAYQQVPFQVVWCVRSDGTLLGMTYLKDQEVVGWHRHDTDGEFESVAVISEGGEDVLYCIVKRTIGGATKRYVERMNTRSFSDAKDWFFVDSGLTYDGRNTGATTMTLTTATDWTYQNGAFTLTASAATFAAGDVGTAEVHFEVGTQVIRLAITGYTSATVVTVSANRDIQASLQGVATTDWGLARKSFAGLDHLEGKTCSVLADGNVHPQAIVSSGAISLQAAAVVVHAGLPITADIETLGITIQNQETILDKKKLITALRLMVENTRGLKIGPTAANLVEIKQRATENYDQATMTTTGIVEDRIPATWSKDGRCFIRQEDPLPATILGIIPDVTVGGA